MAIPCDICGKGAPDKAALKRHKKLRHPKRLGVPRARRPQAEVPTPNALPVAAAPPVQKAAPKSTADTLVELAEGFEAKARTLRSMAEQLRKS